jgi:hypothetical protein
MVARGWRSEEVYFGGGKYGQRVENSIYIGGISSKDYCFYNMALMVGDDIFCS